MRIKRLIYIIPCLLLVVFAGCAIAKANVETLDLAIHPLTIIQGEKRIEMYASDTIISMSKKSFTLEFVSRRYDTENKLFYSTQIATTRDSEAFNPHYSQSIYSKAKLPAIYENAQKF